MAVFKQAQIKGNFLGLKKVMKENKQVECFASHLLRFQEPSLCCLVNLSLRVPAHPVSPSSKPQRGFMGGEWRVATGGPTPLACHLL